MQFTNGLSVKPAMTERTIVLNSIWDTADRYPGLDPGSSTEGDGKLCGEAQPNVFT